MTDKEGELKKRLEKELRCEYGDEDDRQEITDIVIPSSEVNKVLDECEKEFPTISDVQTRMKFCGTENEVFREMVKDWFKKWFGAREV